MNAQPDLDFWKQSIGLLFAQTTATRIDPAGNPLRPVVSARTPEPDLDR
jgi:hypothetical protein